MPWMKGACRRKASPEGGGLRAKGFLRAQGAYPKGVRPPKSSDARKGLRGQGKGLLREMSHGPAAGRQPMIQKGHAAPEAARPKPGSARRAMMKGGSPTAAMNSNLYCMYVVLKYNIQQKDHAAGIAGEVNQPIGGRWGNVEWSQWQAFPRKNAAPALSAPAPVLANPTTLAQRAEKSPHEAGQRGGVT